MDKHCKINWHTHRTDAHQTERKGAQTEVGMLYSQRIFFLVMLKLISFGRLLPSPRTDARR